MLKLLFCDKVTQVSLLAHFPFFLPPLSQELDSLTTSCVVDRQSTFNIPVSSSLYRQEAFREVPPDDCVCGDGLMACFVVLGLVVLPRKSRTSRSTLLPAALFGDMRWANATLGQSELVWPKRTSMLARQRFHAIVGCQNVIWELLHI